MIANVHSIETFSSLDGPGIRYVLFLQGCNMACKYCHNVDATIRTTNRQMSVDEVVTDFLKYRAFYKNGGITVSGGEPLMQVEFIVELFKKLKEYGIHTAIQTQGSLYRDTYMFLELINLTDLFIVDLKGVNNLEALSIAGARIDNTFKLLDNLNYLNKKFWITYVLLPGINDKDETAKEMANILNKYNSENFDFRVLPYHKLGLDKYRKLGKTYELENLKEATKDDVRSFLLKLESFK